MEDTRVRTHLGARVRVIVATALFGIVGVAGVAQASIIYGNNASNGSVNIEAFDSVTGLLFDQFLVPNLTARGDNGRGVAVLGHTIYYTTANSGNIYVTNDSVPHPDLGILVNTGFPGIANISTDGVFIYASSYQTASGIVNKYNTAGTLVGTVNIGTGFGRDGFEVQNNPNIAGGALTFISNRGDASSPYDVYAADGTLLASAFIDPSKNGFGNGQTGIAYDGNHYFVSQIFGNELLEYDGTGAFIRAINLASIPNPFTGRLLEDLSAIGNTVTNPPTTPGPSPVPEPSAILLLASGLAGFAAWRRTRKQS